MTAPLPPSRLTVGINVTRRVLLGLVGGIAVFHELPALAADAAATPTTLWYPAPAVESDIIGQGLPVGNGRIGGLVGGDPNRDLLYLADSALWTGGLNAALGGDGQFPYDTTNFGTAVLLAKVIVNVTGHTMSAIAGYRRQLDLGSGTVNVSYTHQGVAYRRDIYASYPDDVVVMRLPQSGGGSYTGSVVLNGARGETASSGAFGAAFANGLKYSAAVKVSSSTGTITTSGATVTFTGCQDLLIVIGGGTNYVPDPAMSFKNSSLGYRDQQDISGGHARRRLAAYPACAGLPGTLRQVHDRPGHVDISTTRHGYVDQAEGTGSCGCAT